MKHLISLLMLTVSACTGGTVQDDPAGPIGCSVHSPKDGQMWINAMPGPDATPTLITVATVTAPTPGYAFDLKVQEVLESYPPHFVFELVTIPPNGIVAQVETETHLRIDLRNFAYSEIQSAVIRCGGDTLLAFDSVETAY